MHSQIQRSSVRTNFVLATLLLSIASAFSGASAHAERKVALVVGNAAYARIQQLDNPVNDAVDIAASLRRIGFAVLFGSNADRPAMRRLVDEFGRAIQDADIALFYYSGHGVQIEGENYLVPVSAEVAVAADVPDECLSLSRVASRMTESGAKTNVIVLDACRDNPFKAVSRGIERGLAVMGQKPPESIVVYATSENEKADDGSGRNGVFTSALLRNLERKESLADILLDVKAQVRAATKERQKPAVYENLTRRVYLAGGAGGASSAAPAAANHQPAAPTFSVDRGYGSLVVSSVTGGRLYLDGKAMGDLPAGAKATLDSVQAGERRLEMQYPTGEKESGVAEVRSGQSSTYGFTWKKPVEQKASKPAVQQTAQNLATLRVKNDSGRRIVDIYVSPLSSSRWGSSYTGSAVVEPGASFDVPVTPGYDYRVKIDFSQGSSKIGSMPSTPAGGVYVLSVR